MFQCCSLEASHPRLLPQSLKDSECLSLLSLLYLSLRLQKRLCMCSLIGSSELQSHSIHLRILWRIISVQLLSCVQLFSTLQTATCQASLSITNCQSLLKLMSIKSVMPSNHLMLWRIELSIWMVQSEELKHWGEWKWWSWGQNLDFLKQIPSSYKTRRQIIVTYPPSLPTVS